MLTLVLLLLAGYLIGSIPFGYVLVRLVRGVDIRQHGSGNIGATNVGRVLGWKWFPVVFLLDLVKGLVPVGMLLYVWTPATLEGLTSADVAALVGMAVILGHLFPAYLGLRGGKGVATGAGVVAVLAPWPAAVAVGVWLGTFLPFRYVSLASIIAAVGLAVAQLIWAGQAAFAPSERAATAMCLAAATLVIVRHRTNMSRLLAGTEPRVGRRTNPASESA
ncbi:MAG TPA: glycerol-3-phosphate 1-O-acyltransferase PlsY [Gemmatales bacterium]|nr:glycerol-3-phosphate 1-O-acyltransferase PlsY [Gemmatales bacterium]HMP60433.1 glycerol-3-phosphate 1-O-acyltransferase PlsY [Gemmatales bacterium]